MAGIGQRLKQERLRLKLSQSALGAAGGVETNAQGNYESGVRSPRADYLERIADTGIDVAYVVTGIRTDGACSALNGHAATLMPTAQPGSPDTVSGVVQRLQESLHDITENLYQITRLADARAESSHEADLKSQLDGIRSEAENIALATIRLIFVTSRLN